MANAIKLTRVFNHYNRNMAVVTLHTLHKPLHSLHHYFPSICRLIQCTLDVRGNPHMELSLIPHG